MSKMLMSRLQNAQQSFVFYIERKPNCYPEFSAASQISNLLSSRHFVLFGGFFLNTVSFSVDFPIVFFILYFYCNHFIQLTKDERSDNEEEDGDESSSTQDEVEQRHKPAGSLVADKKYDKNGGSRSLSPPENICWSKTVCWLVFTTLSTGE